MRIHGDASSLPLALQPGTCRSLPLRRSRHWNAPTDRASLRLLHGARRMHIHGDASSLPLNLALQPGTCRSLPLRRSRQWNVSTDRASLRLLHGARRKRTESACSSLPLALQPLRLLSRGSLKAPISFHCVAGRPAARSGRRAGPRAGSANGHSGQALE